LTEKEVRRLRRSDLLELLVEQRKENERLEEQIKILEKKLEDRTIQIDAAGSIAEAALRLNDVFEAAQAACEQYKENIKIKCEQMEEETRKKCEDMLSFAHDGNEDNEETNSRNTDNGESGRRIEACQI